MRWLIEGADRLDGSEQVITVEAGSPAEAEMIASQRGLMISNVSREPASAAQLLGAMVQDKRVRPQMIDLPDPPSQTPLAEPVNFIERDLRIARPLLMVLAVIGYVIAAGALAGSAAALWNASHSGDYSLPVALLAIGLGAIMLAAVLHANSAMCAAMLTITRSRFIRH